MIAFATALAGGPDQYAELALPGIRRAAEPDSAILTRGGLPIRRAYNQLMDEAAAIPGLEALVLLHQDLELIDDSLPRRVRSLLGDPRVGLLGPLGARNVTLHLWLSTRELRGTVAATGVERRFSSGVEQVDGVDGALMVLAPWVVRGIRFGESAEAPFHGYDAELSLRVRAHGGTVFCEDIPYFHHRVHKGDLEAQRRAWVALARAWDPCLRPREWGPAFQP